MRGIWLTKNECLPIFQVTSNKFDQTLGQSCKCKFVKHRKMFFIKESMMPKHFKKIYADKMVELDDDGQTVEEILGDITALSPSGSNNDEMNAARLDNIKARTKLIEEKLADRKQELWAEWSEAFFTVFTEAFAKFKNELISLHLNESQISTLNDKLEGALSVMQDKLDAMWINFKEDENVEEDKTV